MTTGVKAVLGAGTATFIPDYGLADSSDRPDEHFLAAVIESGVSYIDAAVSYGSAHGALAGLKHLLRARSVRICSKLPAADLVHSIAESEAKVGELVRHLAQDNVDSLLLHSAGVGDIEDSRVVGSLEHVRAKGFTARVGASTYGTAAARAALSAAWCDVVQVEHSILNPSVVSACSDRRSDQELVVRSVLCKGLLTRRRHNARHLDRAALAILARLEEVASAWDFTLEELAIRFALDTPGVDVALVGVGNMKELQTALSAYRREPLTAKQMDVLREFDCSDEDWTHPERWAQ